MWSFPALVPLYRSKKWRLIIIKAPLNFLPLHVEVSLIPNFVVSQMCFDFVEVWKRKGVCPIDPVFDVQSESGDVAAGAHLGGGGCR